MPKGFGSGVAWKRLRCLEEGKICANIIAWSREKVAHRTVFADFVWVPRARFMYKMFHSMQVQILLQYMLQVT